jgi:ATP-dependent helicase YprA (DUF1998 family)
MSKATATEIRKHVKHIEGAWIRVFRDGIIWAGSRLGPNSAQKVADALTKAGYTCSFDGKLGTSGENVITVKEKIK